MSANSRSGSNTVNGTSGSDHLNGGSGADIINGLGGNDRINGGAGNDILDGGAGNDIVNGDAGDDLGVYVLSENAGSTDVYDGGSGRDTLQLVMTRAQWQTPAVQADIARFLTFLAQVTNPVNGQATNANFTFSFGLTVSKFEALQIMVDGVAFDPRDQAVTLGDDVMAAGEETASVSVNVLANDNVPDLIATLTNTQPAHGSVVLTQTTGSGSEADTASFVYTPDAAHWQYLAAGQTATDTFTYTVTDSDGDTRTATVTVTITGSNDGPTLGAVVAAGAVVEDGATTVSGDIAFADIDLADAHTASSTADGSGYLGTFTVSVTDNGAADGAGSVAWSFAVDNAAIQHLGAGQVLTQTYTVTVSDGQGGTVSQPVTVTITGTNDAPTITTGDFSGTIAEDSASQGGVAGPATLVITEASDQGIRVIERADLRIAPNPDLGDAGQPSVAVTGTISAEGESDRYVITLRAGEILTLDVDFAAGFGSGPQPGGYPDDFGLDSEILIYDSAGNLLNINDDAPVTSGGAGSPQSQDSYLRFTATADGVYTVVVRGYATGTPGYYSTGDYTLNVSVDSASNATLTDTGTVTFADVDLSDGHTVTVVSNGSGYLGELTAVVSNPSSGDGAGEVTWTFAVPNPAIQFLAVGQTLTQSYTLRVDDGQGGTVDQVVQVTLTGSNDAPIITSSQAARTLTEGGATSTTGVMTFGDVDLTDGHIVSITPVTAGNIGTFVATISDASTGDGAGGVTWTFQVDPAEIEYLSQNQGRQQRYSVLIDDGNGGTTEQLVIITIRGTNDRPTITSAVSSGATIEDGVTNVTGEIAFADVDLRDGHSVTAVAGSGGYLGTFNAFVTDASFGDGAGSVSWNFAVDNGAIQYLAAGQVLTQTYTVTISDGRGGTVQQPVTVTVIGTNDAPTITAALSSGAVTEDGTVSAAGTIAFADVDLRDGHSVSSSANGNGYLGSFTATVSDDGSNDGAGSVSWDFTVDNAAIQHLAAGETLTQTYTVTVSDGNGGTVDQTVTVTLTGTNDGPTVTAAGDTGTVVEDGQISASGVVDFGDIDLRDGHTIASVAGGENYLGAFTATLVDDGSNDGAGSITWNFVLDNEAADSLNTGDVLTQTYTVTVSDGNGGTVSQVVTISIEGRDDNTAPTVSDITLTGTTVSTGSVAFPLVFAGHGNQPGVVVYTFADTNGDGRPDTPDASSPLQGNNSYTYNYGMDLGDIDGDGDIDVVVAGNDGLLSFTNIGDVTGDGYADYQMSTLVSGWGSYDVALADLNGDGLLDVVSSRYYEGLVELINNGDTNGDGLANEFSSRSLGSSNSYSYGITAADMNGDGRDDILVSNYYGQSLLYVNLGDTNGDGLTNYTTQVLGTGSIYSDMGVDTGDIDGDGDIDFVMGQWNGSYNNLYLNDGDTNGDGQIDFTQVELNTGTGSYTMESALVDIDGDGDLDIVASDAGYGRTTISYNQGDLNADGRPDFTHQSVQSGYGYGLAVGDIDDDGDMDIVVPVTGGSSLYLQNQGDTDGDGQLNFVTVTLAPGTASWDAAFTPNGGGSSGGTGVREDGRAVTGAFIGDDADEDDDAASLTYSITSAPSEGTVINNGDGTFSFAPGSGFQDLAYGETRTVTFTYTATDSHGAVSNTGTVTVNVAGANDRVVAGADTAQALENGPAVTGNVLLNDSDVDASDELTVSQVNGSGSQVGVQTVLFSGALVTVNADGSYIYDPNGAFEELAAGETGTDTFSYQVTDGNGGQVTQTVTITLTGSNDAPTVSDVSTGGAGFPLVFAGYSSTGLAVYSFVDSDNDGRVDTPDSSSPLSNSYSYNNSRVAVGDLDGDGDIDVVIGGNGVTSFTNVGDVTGDGADDFVQTQLSYDYTQAVEMADLNGDGLMDIVAAPYYGTLTQFINQGDDNSDGIANDFAIQSTPSSAYYSRGITTGDLNGDGREDVIITSYYTSEILLNQGDQDGDGQVDYTTQQLTQNNSYDNMSPVTGDIDGDGDVDFLVSRGWNSEVLYVNNGDTDGDGQINFSTVELSTQGYTEDSELVDIDGDGDLDVVSSGYYGDPTVAYNQGDTNSDGNPDFVIQNLYSPYTNYGNRGIAVGDIDGDGDLDIVLPSESGNASYLSNQGDLNGDGQLDFVAVRLNGVGSSWDADFTGSSGGAAREDGPAILGRFRGDDVDSDDDRSSLTYTITSQPAEGRVINNGDGTFSFAPGSDFQDLDGGETRTVTFTYTATDANGATSNTGTVTIVVSGRDEEDGGANAMVIGGVVDAKGTPEGKDSPVEVSPNVPDGGVDTGKVIGPQILPGTEDSAGVKGEVAQVLPGTVEISGGKDDDALVLPGATDPLANDDFLLDIGADSDFGPQILPGAGDRDGGVFELEGDSVDLGHDLPGLEYRLAMLFVETAESDPGIETGLDIDSSVNRPDPWAV